MPADDPRASDASLLSVADYERAAEALLHPSALGYFAGGARGIVPAGSSAGGAGAQHVLEILLGEFDIGLALTGAPRAEDLNPSFLTAPWLDARP